MRLGKVIAVALVIALVALAVTVVRWFSRCPLDMKLEAVEPSVMVDESLLATLSLNYAGNGYCRVNNGAMLAEAFVTNQWVRVTKVSSGWLYREGKDQIMLLVPKETVAYRLRFEYSPDTPKERLAMFLRDHAPKLVNRIPWLQAWLWPPWVPGAAAPSRAWTPAELELGTR